MGDFEVLGGMIRELESSIRGDFLSSEKPDWKLIWQRIREIGTELKGVKFPSREEHQEAWGRFQGLVVDVKSSQKSEREEWERKKTVSESLRKRIVTQARSARPLSPVADAVGTVGLGAVFSSILGSSDETKRDLLAASERLKKGWNMLAEFKGDMLGRDKHEAFESLNRTKEILDHEWAAYKQARQKAYENRQREFEEKQQAWRERVEANIRDLEERRERLNGVLIHKESHLDELRLKLSDARSAEYGSRVSGWIAEEISSIQNIRSKLANIETWILEARDKLNS